MSQKKVILVTGASSGIGLDTAIRLLKKGCIVYGVARRIELLSKLEEFGGHALFLDLNDDASIENCVQSVIKSEGKIDILINNAGYGLGGAIEMVSIKDAKEQFQVNVFGLARLCQLVIPYMREQHSGRIINISSIAGLFSSPYLGWYHASKYSVEALSDALRLEVAQFGIKVSIIEPGLTGTNWGVIAAKGIRKNSEKTFYELSGGKVAHFYEHFYENGNNITKASSISKKIEHACFASHPKLRYPVGKFSTMFILFSRIFGGGTLDFFKRLIFRIR